MRIAALLSRAPRGARAVAYHSEEVARDPERLARFQREAELLASLSHPHIAAIYGFEEADGKPLQVLELIQGEDLSPGTTAAVK